MVSELNDHLDERVRAGFELLDHIFAVALVSLHAEVVLCDQRIEVLSCAVNLGEEVLIEMKFQGMRFWEVRADGAGGEVKFVAENEHINVVVKAVGGGAVHHAVFAYEARSAVFVNDKFKGFVVPAILAVAVPVLVGALFESDRGRIVKANNEGGSLDCLEGGRVGGIGGEEGFTGRGPDVAVLRGESANSGRFFGDGIDSAELGFEFGSVELLTVDFVRDFEELIFADDDNIGMILMGVFDGVVARRGRYTARIEHPLVRFHADWKFPHILWL